MAVSQSRVIRRNQISYAVSVALALMASNAAFAQTPAPAKAAAEEEVTTVLVVGTRLSQQSAIDRKKNANTAMDSIVAEDVGAFPDRNIGEAISRIAGVALDRGEYGEGVSVNIRGNSADVTRVELDGQGVQSGGGTNLNGGGDGRGVELRELSSDLIKSVDVVKGSTPDMTEGSLGGSVIIKTRTGLDFKKPYYSLRLSAAQGSLNKKISPDANLVLSNKFLDGRLGVIFNGSASKASNESHSINAGGTNNRAGPSRLIDWDNSAEKTYSYNPDLVIKDETGTNQMFVASVPAGQNSYAGSPLSVLTKSANAKTKAECYTAFPDLTTAERASITHSGGRANSVTQRENELLSCLDQWNDYTPNLLRNFVLRQEEKRVSGDLRLDFKVNEKLSVYAKINKSDRSVTDHYNNYGFGGISVNPGGTVFNPATGTNVRPYTDVNGVRTAVPGLGYYTYASTATWRGGNMPLQGAVANVDPASVLVDSKHNVTQYQMSNGSAFTDTAIGQIDTKAQYVQAGGVYKDGGFKAEFLLGDARSQLRRVDIAVGFAQPVGPVLLNITPTGLWNYTFPAGTTFDQTDPDAYVNLAPQGASVAVPAGPNVPVAIPAYTSAQKPLMTSSSGMRTQNSRHIETSERTGKLDLSYSLSDRIPYFTSVKSGVNLRDASYKTWGDGGAQIASQVGTYGQPGYQREIGIPSNKLRSDFRGCQDTPGSLAPGGQPCNYGFTPRTTNNILEGTSIVTVDQYRDIIAQGLSLAPNTQFYASAKDRPANLTNGWNTIDIDKVLALSGLQNFNLDCIKECIGTDGKLYQQPTSQSSERTTSGYFMANFDVDHLPFSKKSLPFGMTLDGNMGFRYVRINTKATGFMQFDTVKLTPSYNEQTPDAAGGVIWTTYRRNTQIEKTTTDFMPIYNLALWAVPDQLVIRYNHAKTIARPPVSKLWPSGTCRYDERLSGQTESSDEANGLDQACSGTMGNPGLKPFTNSNRNLSVEWYMNKDTMFTVSGFKQVGKIGYPDLRETVRNGNLFADSDIVDAATGVRLADLEFEYSQWANRPATTRRGLEFGTKTALTFLPWYLKYTGLDANYTRVRSTSTAGSIRDLLNGEVMPAQGEPAYSFNTSLWYDDGSFSARLALQVVAQKFECLMGCGDNSRNNFNAPGSGLSRVPYSPGMPLFTDETRWLDAKMAYKFKSGIEIFVEARNLGLARKSTSTGASHTFADGTNHFMSDKFSGRRVMAGIVFRSKQ